MAKDLKQENVSKGGVYVGRGQKSQGLRDPPQGDFHPKENIVESKGRRVDLLGAEDRMLRFKVLKRSQGYRAAPIYTGNQRLDTAYPTSHSPVPQGAACAVLRCGLRGGA